MPQTLVQAVEDVGGSVIASARGVVSSVAGGIISANEQVQEALDRPAQSVGLASNPTRIASRTLMGAVRAGENFINQGVLGSLDILGRGFTGGLGEIPRNIAALTQRFGGMAGPRLRGR